MKTITPQELAKLRGAGRPIDLVDVRSPVEYREVHAEQARSVPLDTLDPRAVMASRGDAARGPLYLICRSGGRSRKAAEAFQEAGFDDVASVEGGTLAWERAGLPVVRGEKTVSLERQVRIAAGSLVALGTALGVLVHPAFLGLPAFIGAGLVFSGVTDTCGMAMILARLPCIRAACDGVERVR